MKGHIKNSEDFKHLAKKVSFSVSYLSGYHSFK